jgi:hypothetical protein
MLGLDARLGGLLCDRRSLLLLQCRYFLLASFMNRDLSIFLDVEMLSNLDLIAKINGALCGLVKDACLR